MDAFRAADNPLDEAFVADLEQITERTRQELLAGVSRQRALARPNEVLNHWMNEVGADELGANQHNLLVVTKHVASLLALSLVLAACGGWEGGQTPGTQTVLQIKVWPNGKGREAPREWKLHCDRAGGTHPAPEKACEQLFDLADPFAPTPGDAVCTEIYGGPAVAEVEGLYRGETVDAKFARTNGCEIDRWDRHAFLFPGKPDSP